MEIDGGNVILSDDGQKIGIKVINHVITEDDELNGFFEIDLTAYSEINIFNVINYFAFGYNPMGENEVRISDKDFIGSMSLMTFTNSGGYPYVEGDIFKITIIYSK